MARRENRRLVPVAAMAARLRARREAARLSQSEVARRIDIDHAEVCRWETGDRLPSLGSLYALAGVYGCPAGELLPPAGEGGAQ